MIKGSKPTVQENFSRPLKRIKGISLRTLFITTYHSEQEYYLDDLSGFQRDLLYVIAGTEEETSGQDIKDEIKQYYSTDVNHGRLYPNLDTIGNKGLVEKGQLDRRTNHYDITDRAEGLTEEQYID